MSYVDWKRYYAPILSHKANGECRIWQGKLFRKPERAALKAQEINRASTGNWRCIGIAAIRGNRRNPQVQKWLLENSK
jgi:hypothetical protein